MTDRPGQRVAFRVTPAMSREVQQIINETELTSAPALFRSAFTLLRIHVDAAKSGQQIYLADSSTPEEKTLISLPFFVEQQSEDSSTAG